MPVNSARKSGEYDDFPNDFGLIRVIYARGDMGAVRRAVFRNSIRKIIKNGVIFGGDMPVKTEAEKFYSDGYKLAMKFTGEIIEYLADGEKREVVIFSRDINDCAALGGIITLFDVKILTPPELVSEYSEYLNAEFGIANGAAAALPLSGKTVLIMEGCENFSAKGAKAIVNFSRKEICLPAVAPDSVYYSPPDVLKCKALFLRRGDFLQTALDFFGLSYENIKLLSVKTG